MSLAVQFSEYGTSDVLRVVDVQPPTPGPGQVRLAVRAAGVNPADWKTVQGWMRDQVPLDPPAGLRLDLARVADAAAVVVGPFAVQLAVARGARVIGTASERNHDRLREFGAIPVTYGEEL